MNSRQFFQYLSYLQYPFLVMTLYFCVQMVMAAGHDRLAFLDALNYMLLFAGVGVGLSSLQDPTKTHNRMSRRVWEHPRKGRYMLILLALEAFVPIVVGLYGAFRANDTAMNQLALGLVAFGLGMIGLLKTAIEMRDNFRTDHPSMRGEAAGP